MATMRKLLLALFLALIVAQPTFLYAQAVVNSEVVVDIVGKDGVDARAEAMSKAEYDGLISLLERLGPPGQAKDIMATLDSKKITAMVQGVQILDEKISGNRYRARMIISFDGSQISQVMASLSAADAAQKMPNTIGSFLVIPGLELNNQKLLWEESNIWKRIWDQVALEVNAGDVLVPYGDMTDAAGLAYDNMMTTDYQSLANYTIRYGVSDIILLQGKYNTRPGMSLVVTLRRLGRQESSVTVRTYRADPQETREILFARAARDIVSDLQAKKSDEVNNASSVLGGDRYKIMMLATISTMRSWTELRKKISELPMVDRIDTLAFSARQVDVMVHYRGTEESFTNALVRKSIRLKKNNGYWVISND